MIRRPPRSTRIDTLFPYTTLFRSEQPGALGGVAVVERRIPAVAPEIGGGREIEGGDRRAWGGLKAFGRPAGGIVGQIGPGQPHRRAAIIGRVVLLARGKRNGRHHRRLDRKSTRLNSSH